MTKLIKFSAICLFILSSNVNASDEIWSSIQEAEKSALTGNPSAENYLGIQYALGKNISKNFSKSIEWFSKAAEKNYVKSEYNLGKIYSLLYLDDDEKSVYWFLKAAQAGDPDAQFSLGDILSHDAYEHKNYTIIRHLDSKKSLYWLNKAIRNGNVRAYNSIGLMYIDARGVNSDTVKSFEYIQKGAKHGDSDAQFNLGSAYEHGIGVTPNPEIAFTWYLTSAFNGKDLAINSAKKLSSFLSQEQVDQLKATAKSNSEKYTSKDIIYNEDFK